MPTRWLEAWSNGANGSEWSWSIRSHGGGKTSVSSLGVWDKRNLPYDALQRGVLSPLQKPTPERGPSLEPARAARPWTRGDESPHGPGDHLPVWCRGCSMPHSRDPYRECQWHRQYHYVSR